MIQHILQGFVMAVVLVRTTMRYLKDTGQIIDTQERANGLACIIVGAVDALVLALAFGWFWGDSQ